MKDDYRDQKLVVKPKNLGTAAAILYSLLRLSHLDPKSMVVIMPSDHHISDDETFMSYVESAFELVQLREDLVVLLGIKPERAETEYGWIEPVSSHLAGNPDGLSWVRRFWEKPTWRVAHNLMRRGCLWNSFVMVGNVSAFLKMFQQALPEFFRRFRSIEGSLNTPDEAKAVNELYSQLPDVNFSQHVLGKRPSNLAVLAVSGLTWNDLGRPHRVLSTLATIGNRRYTQSTATSAIVC
jgi:mannose-1-phosphate guanylyltransferase